MALLALVEPMAAAARGGRWRGGVDSLNNVLLRYLGDFLNYSDRLLPSAIDSTGVPSGSLALSAALGLLWMVEDWIMSPVGQVELRQEWLLTPIAERDRNLIDHDRNIHQWDLRRNFRRV